MAIIGMTLLDEAVDAPVSAHFGRAPWLGVFSDALGPLQLIRNTALHGKGVVALLVGAGCTDAIIGGIGPGAHERLVAAGIRTWRASEGSTPQGLLDAFAAGRLEPLAGPTHGGRRQGGGTC